MKKFLVVGFFLLPLYVFSQTEEEDAILDSLIEGFFSTDSLMVNLSKTNYLYTTFSFDESVFLPEGILTLNSLALPQVLVIWGGKTFLSVWGQPISANSIQSGILFRLAVDILSS